MTIFSVGSPINTIVAPTEHVAQADDRWVGSHDAKDAAPETHARRIASVGALDGGVTPLNSHIPHSGLHPVAADQASRLRTVIPELAQLQLAINELKTQLSQVEREIEELLTQLQAKQGEEDDAKDAIQAKQDETEAKKEAVDSRWTQGRSDMWQAVSSLWA